MQVLIFSTTLSRLNATQKTRNPWTSDTNDSMIPVLYRIWWNSQQNDLK